MIITISRKRVCIYIVIMCKGIDKGGGGLGGGA